MLAQHSDVFPAYLRLQLFHRCISHAAASGHEITRNLWVMLKSLRKDPRTLINDNKILHHTCKCTRELFDGYGQMFCIRIFSYAAVIDSETQTLPRRHMHSCTRAASYSFTHTLASTTALLQRLSNECFYRFFCKDWLQLHMNRLCRSHAQRMH